MQEEHELDDLSGAEQEPIASLRSLAATLARDRTMSRRVRVITTIAASIAAALVVVVAILVFQIRDVQKDSTRRGVTILNLAADTNASVTILKCAVQVGNEHPSSTSTEEERRVALNQCIADGPRLLPKETP